MRFDDFSNTRKGENGQELMVLGHQIPDWFSGDDDVAVFSSTTGFNDAQVYREAHGKFTADFGKAGIREFRDAGHLETELRKRRLTSFEGIRQYRPTRY